MVETMVAANNAIAEVLLDESITGNIKKLRITALRQITPLIEAYYREVQNERLLLPICRKKIDFILHATTKREIDLIMGPPKIQDDGSKIIPAHQYVIPEEELIMWSYASARMPLRRKGVQRFKELTLMVFSEHADAYDALKPKEERLSEVEVQEN